MYGRGYFIDVQGFEYEAEKLMIDKKKGRGYNHSIRNTLQTCFYILERMRDGISAPCF